ncbi:MAG TPA: DUF1826 domain-containing protein [Aliiroseovarius sp.]|nr:DUF1826 domain-containing protein [Aliiroseovarius sp.]
MNSLNKINGDVPTVVELAGEPAALSSFLQPGCAAAIWRRQTPPDVQSWLDGIDGEALPRARVTLRPHAVGEAVQRLFDMANLPDREERDWLQHDIVRLADVFSDLMRARYVRLRLDVVTTNACRIFHVDVVTARLVCTYRGTGTQYGISTGGAEPRDVFTVQTGSPILLRGSLWPTDPPSGLMHRSPPIEGTGETRLVLVLDPVTDLEDDI